MSATRSGPPPPGQRFASSCFFQEDGGIGIGPFLENYSTHRAATTGRGYISLPTGNHDYSRPSYGRSGRGLRVIHAMLLTMPGVPFIYYGDEIGMHFRDDLPSKEGGYGRTGARTPMQWDAAEANLGFSTAPADSLYLPVDDDPNAPTVADQETDPDSLLHLVRRLIALRHAHPALAGDTAFVPLGSAEGGRAFAYRRGDGRGAFVVAINPDQAACTIVLPELARARVTLAEGADLKGGRLSLAPVSFAVLALD